MKKVFYIKKPYIESSPAYVSVPDGIRTANIEGWKKDFLCKLSENNLGVFTSPFKHQDSSFRSSKSWEGFVCFYRYKFRKTECFMWHN
ncbi:MAG: hypothetical protein ACLTAI_13240 [Thomasclavelia sp.]